MRATGLLLCAAALGMHLGCSGPEKAAPPSSGPAPAPQARPASITQLYVTAPRIARGEKSLLCYGVENASSVKLTPPPQVLPPSLSRCLEVAPAKTTTYTLMAAAESGPPVSREVTVSVGPPHPRILDVTVNALSIKAGDVLSICYRVEDTRSVRIDPIGYARAADSSGCTTDQPKRTTTYTVTASGESGDQDRQSVTVKVQ
ncbi:MAG TPA: hypothetical protein VFA33_03505 [Bryobacteraceae bacterium]|nr:hypothetical protein [Bryobacteraceae bacterium]